MRVELLSRPEIEAYFGADAVMAWLTLQGAETEPSSVQAALSTESPKARLHELVRREVTRRFDAVEVCRGIASLTLEADSPAEIRGLLTRLTAD